MKPIEKAVITKRIQLIARSKRLFSFAIKEQYLQALKVIDRTSIDQIAYALKGSISKAPIETAFKQCYSSTAKIAMLWKGHLVPKKKDAVDDFEESVFEESMSNYALTKAGKRIALISETTEEYIIRATQKALIKGTEEGLGVEAIKNLILDFVNSQYKEMTSARANLIAQTEIITASNQAAVEAANSTGEKYMGFWSTSGNDNVRASHTACEEYSTQYGGVAPGDTFPNGLEYPGDPNGEPEEVCNCHCTYLVEIV